MQHAGDLDRDGRPDLGDRPRLRREMLVNHALHRGPRERRLPGQHLVQDAAQRVEVAAAVQIALPGRLLGAHVRGCADRDAGVGQPIAARGVHGARDAEVRDHRVPALEHDVLGLDVPVDHPAGVRVRQGVGHLPRQRHGLLERQLLFTPDAVPQRLALDVGHDVEQIVGRAGGQLGGGPSRCFIRRPVRLTAVRPLSYSGRMCGWLSPAAISISRRKRS